MNFSEYISLRVLPGSVTGETEKMLHLSYKEEVRFLNYIKDGDIDALMNLMKIIGTIPVGRLSENSLKQSRYLAICFITLAVRYAISGGMNESEAYSFSDYFINRLDFLHSGEEIINHMALGAIKLTNSVKDSKVNAKYSPYVRKCIQFINQNPDKKITVGELASLCGVSGDYLSSVFKKEYGEKLSAFIMERKLDAAANMIIDGRSQSDVCYALAFSSQSYFINAFKKKFGVTPGKFKSQMK